MPRYVPRDAGYRAAREAGYRSRAALKLLEIDRRFRVLRRGQRVVELGCWPGGWLQVAAERVGPRGLVVGVDLRPVDDLGRPNVRTIVGDLRSEDTQARVLEALGGVPADVLLSDAAPKLSGIRVADEERQLELVEAAVEAAGRLLRPGGAAVLKLFSPVERRALRRLRDVFREASAYRPGSTRRGSAEIYAVAKGKR